MRTALHLHLQLLLGVTTETLVGEYPTVVIVRNALAIRLLEGIPSHAPGLMPTKHEPARSPRSQAWRK